MQTAENPELRKNSFRILLNEFAPMASPSHLIKWKGRFTDDLMIPIVTQVVIRMENK